MHEYFRKAAAHISNAAGTAWAFMLALVLIALWGFTGPYFDYSDTWQLAINTTTTIVTFLMVFLIQNTQTRDTRAMQLKLDEIIRAEKGARSSLVDVEELSDQELEALHVEFKKIHDHYLNELTRRKTKKGLHNSENNT